MADREPGRVQSVCKAMDLLSCLAEVWTPLPLGELERTTRLRRSGSPSISAIAAGKIPAGLRPGKERHRAANRTCDPLLGGK